MADRLVPLGYRLFDDAHDRQVAAAAVRVVAAHARGPDDLRWLCGALGLDSALTAAAAAAAGSDTAAGPAGRVGEAGPGPDVENERP